MDAPKSPYPCILNCDRVFETITELRLHMTSSKYGHGTHSTTVARESSHLGYTPEKIAFGSLNLDRAQALCLLENLC